MAVNRTFQKIYKEVTSTRDFSQLSEFRSPEVWSVMERGDRELLALALVSQGEMQLIESNNAVTETFALAGKIAPDSLSVWLRQGRVFATQRNNIRCLVLACKALEKAVRIDPECFSGWFSWATVLLRVGIFHNDPQSFQEAEQKFQEIHNRFADKKGEQSPGCEFYWKWGLSWFYYGKHSGEAMDFRAAIAKFQCAAEKGLNKSVFWNDYGNALVDLGCLIGRQELLYDASQLYHKSVEECETYFPAWLNLACCYQELFNVSGAEDFFRLADDSFRSASEIERSDVSLWIKWGMLYVASGRLGRDSRRIGLGIEKYEKADQCEPNHALALERWAEALTLKGSMVDNLDLLKKAEQKVLNALAISPDSSNGWQVYGFCLIELGHYFSDEEYFFSAIDKFQYGASRHPNDYRFYYGMALGYNCLGEMHGDPYILDKALESFSHTITLHEMLEPQFWNDWGIALMRMTEVTGSQNHLIAALEKFEHAIAMQGGDLDTTVLDTQLLYNYGCALDFLGDFTDDIEHYQSSIKVLSQVVILDPDYEHARYNLGLAWSHFAELTSDIDGFEAACDQFHKAVIADREDEMAWNDWGLALLNLSRLVSDPANEVKSLELQGEAEAKLLHAVGLGSLPAFYNLVCLYSLDRNCNAAMHYLERAQSSGALPPIEDVMHDEWLESLRETEAFRTFILQFSKPSND